MGYQTQREKVMEIMTNKIIPNLPERDFDYQKTIMTISAETGASPSIVEDVIRGLIISEKIKESRLLIATDNQLREHMNKVAIAEKEVKEVTDGSNIS